MSGERWWRVQLAVLCLTLATCGEDCACSVSPLECNVEWCNAELGDDDDCARWDDTGCEVDAAIDAQVFADASAGAPVDAGSTERRRGTVFVTDLRVSNDLSAFGLPQRAGASVSIEYLDPTTSIVEPVFGSPELEPGGCRVFVYGVGTNAPPARVDEGAVTIDGTPHGAFSCWFRDGAYECVAAAGVLRAGTQVTASAGEMVVDVPPPPDLSMLNPIGMYAAFDGFAVAANNGVFPVVGSTADDLTVANPDAVGEIVVGNGVGYELLPGFGPIPVQVPAYEFLDDGTATVTVSKGEGTLVGPFTASLAASGEGLTLASASPRPHEFPSQAEDWTLSCAPPDGDCGPSRTIVVLSILRGVATDGDVATGCDGPCLPYEMPAPVERWATFECWSNLGADEVTLFQDGVAAVLGTQPTRVETRLLRATMVFGVDPGDVVTTVAVGHGLVGYSDVSP